MLYKRSVRASNPHGSTSNVSQLLLPDLVSDALSVANQVHLEPGEIDLVPLSLVIAGAVATAMTKTSRPIHPLGVPGKCGSPPLVRAALVPVYAPLCSARILQTRAVIQFENLLHD